MRILGLDLGTKSLGIAITDKSNTLVSPLKVLNFKNEDYEYAINEVEKIIKEKEIAKIVLGLPKNMDGSIGFAGNRSLRFKEMLENKGIEVILVDERLTTKSAEDIIHLNNEHVKGTKNKIDAIAASIILDTYLRRSNNDTKEF